MKKFIGTILKLCKYLTFLVATGAIAIIIGPYHSSPRIKWTIGVIIGQMILGDRIPNAILEMWHIIDGIIKKPKQEREDNGKKDS